jgi:hypothetical protein
MIIERLFAVGLTAFYFFELDQGLLAANAAGEQPDPEMLLAQFRGHALLTALVGMATGGLLVWFFRIVFGWVLAEEANGFGDGTLKAVIGAFLGWQATLIVLFLAPFAAVAIAVGQWLLTGRVVHRRANAKLHRHSSAASTTFARTVFRSTGRVALCKCSWFWLGMRPTFFIFPGLSQRHRGTEISPSLGAAKSSSQIARRHVYL